jgi:hypothetical protein
MLKYIWWFLKLQERRTLSLYIDLKMIDKDEKWHKCHETAYHIHVLRRALKPFRVNIIILLLSCRRFHRILLTSVLPTIIGVNVKNSN